jgi:hypothetical protein
MSCFRYTHNLVVFLYFTVSYKWCETSAGPACLCSSPRVAALWELAREFQICRRLRRARSLVSECVARDLVSGQPQSRTFLTKATLKCGTRGAERHEGPADEGPLQFAAKVGKRVQLESPEQHARERKPSYTTP